MASEASTPRRKLSAIVMVDVSGFSRMMGRDEEGDRSESGFNRRKYDNTHSDDIHIREGFPKRNVTWTSHKQDNFA